MTESDTSSGGVPTDEKGYRNYLMVQLLAVQQESGEAHIQKLLQTEIQSVKNKRAEVLALEKQAVQQRKDVEASRLQLRHFHDLRKKCENICQALQKTIKSRGEITEKMKNEMKQNREEAIKETRERVQSFKDSTEERRKAVEESQRENEALRLQSEELQESFKAEYEKFQTDLHDMFTPSAELQQLQEEANKVNELQEELKNREREHTGCVTGALMLQQQLKWYDEQFTQFAEVAVDPESVKAILEKQRAAGEERIQEARKEAEKVKQKRLDLEAELKELRVKFAALNKKLIQAESQKKAAEKKCRQAQSKVKK